MKIMNLLKKVKDVIINPPFGKPAVKVVKKTAKKRGRKGKKSPRR